VTVFVIHGGAELTNFSKMAIILNYIKCSGGVIAGDKPAISAALSGD
jgi:hypothetical protein